MGIRLLAAGKQRAFSLPSPTLSSSPARQHQNPLASVNVHGLVKDSSDVENVKMYFDLQMTTGRCFPYGSRSVNYLDDVSIHCTSVITSSSSHFSLLNENVVKIENILADTASVRLEKEILIHIRRLGALKLFHACLSKSRMPLAETSPNPQQTAHFRYSSKEYPVKQDITVSGKKEERKLRRSRAKEKNCITSPHSSNHKRISTPSATLQSKSRSVIARNESELSMAVKDVASLERIRLKLEKETGEEVCHERWAEAAGIDLKTLHQRLHVGWHSRDKLIRSTRSLIFFLARNYKGIGVALDDLLQAGSIGVLKGAEKFDNSRGYRFSTYVRYWIRKSMLSLITRNSRGIQLPAVMVKIIKSMQDASKNFRMREGRFPEDDEIVDLTNLSLATIRLARRCSRAMGSLDQLQIPSLMIPSSSQIGGLDAQPLVCVYTRVRTQSSHSSTMSLLPNSLFPTSPTKMFAPIFHSTGSFLSQESTPDTSVETPFEFFMKQRKKRGVSELLESLHPRERQVLLLRYGLDDGRSKSLGEIGSLYDVSKEWIRRIERAAMADVRSRFVQEEFNFY